MKGQKKLLFLTLNIFPEQLSNLLLTAKAIQFLLLEYSKTQLFLSY